MKRKNFISAALISYEEVLINLSILLLRFTLGIIIFIVGSGKVMGWFGGFGLHTSIQFYIKMGIAVPLGYLSCFTEFIGGILISAGLFTRPAAFAVTINMAVATLTLLPKGFIRGGASYPFSLLMIAVAVLLTGPADYSLDALIFKG